MHAALPLEGASPRRATSMTLNVNLTPELEAMVRDKVATGLYS